jgi:hypothetical protein
MVFRNAGSAVQQLPQHSPVEDFANLVTKIASGAANNTSYERTRKRSGCTCLDSYRRGSGAKTEAPSEWA